MANVKITDLTAASAAAKSMLFEVTQDPAGTQASRKLSLTQLFDLDDGTKTSSAPILNLAQTWNSGGVTFTAMKINVTNTASAAASMLIDLQVGGSSKFSVTKDALLTTTSIALGAGSASVPSITFGDADTGLYAHTAGGVAVASQGAIAMRIDSDGSFSSYGPYSLFSYDLIIGEAADVSIARLGIATVGLRNYGAPTSPVTFQVYNTYTDGSNYERGVFDWGTTANTLTIGTQNAGTGSTRELQFVVGGGAARLRIDISGNSFFQGAITVGSNVSIADDFSFYWSSRSLIWSPSDGVVRFSKNANSDFDRIQLGGTTSSFPAIKRVSAGLKFVVADDSASAAVEALSYTSGTPSGGTAAAWKFGSLVTAAVTPDTTRYIELDVAGTLYKVIVST